MSIERPRRALAVAVVAATILLPAALAGATPVDVRGGGELQDLQPATAQPTDGASAQVTATVAGGATTVTLKVEGLDHAAAGTVLGAHVHSGTCVAGNGAAAGPHYNSTGGTVISDETEVWLDFEVQANGQGHAEAHVPFVIPHGGASAVVIHAMHTNHDTGAAGPRWACLPVLF
jgi:Cu-Zn family superoxide dismutase